MILSLFLCWFLYSEYSFLPSWSWRGCVVFLGGGMWVDVYMIILGEAFIELCGVGVSVKPWSSTPSKRMTCLNSRMWGSVRDTEPKRWPLTGPVWSQALLQPQRAKGKRLFLWDPEVWGLLLLQPMLALTKYTRQERRNHTWNRSRNILCGSTRLHTGMSCV